MNHDLQQIPQSPTYPHPPHKKPHCKTLLILTVKDYSKKNLQLKHIKWLTVTVHTIYVE